MRRSLKTSVDPNMIVRSSQIVVGFLGKIGLQQTIQWTRFILVQLDWLWNIFCLFNECCISVWIPCYLIVDLDDNPLNSSSLQGSFCESAHPMTLNERGRYNVTWFLIGGPHFTKWSLSLYCFLMSLAQLIFLTYSTYSGGWVQISFNYMMSMNCLILLLQLLLMVFLLRCEKW